MQNLHTIWLDEKRIHGIIKTHDSIFQFLFHPIVFDEVTGEFHIINNLWYTTYNGAREYFRSPTNDYHVAGKMQIQRGRKLPQLSSDKLIKL